MKTLLVCQYPKGSFSLTLPTSFIFLFCSYSFKIGILLRIINFKQSFSCWGLQQLQCLSDHYDYRLGTALQVTVTPQGHNQHAKVFGCKVVFQVEMVTDCIQFDVFRPSFFFVPSFEFLHGSCSAAKRSQIS